jgi:ATP-dependent Clp protease ATP-binding subunit ClpA
MFERFTAPARECVLRAREEAQALHAPMIGTGHLLLALLDERSPNAYPVLTAAGLTHDAVRAQLARGAEGAPAGLTEEDAEALRSVGIDLDAVLARITETFGPDALTPATASGGRGRRRSGTSSRFTPAGRKVLGLALREAVAHGDRHIDDRHVLLGLLRDDPLVAGILAGQGVPAAALRSALEQARRPAA